MGEFEGKGIFDSLTIVLHCRKRALNKSKIVQWRLLFTSHKLIQRKRAIRDRDLKMLGFEPQPSGTESQCAINELHCENICEAVFA